MLSVLNIDDYLIHSYDRPAQTRCRVWITSETVMNRGAFSCSIYSLCSIYLNCRGRAGRYEVRVNYTRRFSILEILDLQCRMYFLHLPPPPRLPSGVARETVTAVNTVDINGRLVYKRVAALNV